MTEREGTLFLKHTQIVIHWPDGREESLRLGETTRIGRGREGNELAIPDLFQSISRRHLEIRREKDGYRLIDIGSRNGILINGIYAKDSYLRDRDEIRIGDAGKGQELHIEFQLGSESLLAELESKGHATIPPSVGISSESPINLPYFKIRWHNGSTNYFPITKDEIVIGRGPGADLRVPETLRFVSSQQAEVVKKDAGFFIRDLKSANGTLVNNQRIEPEQYHPLGNESIIRIGDDQFGISIGLTFINPLGGVESVQGFMQAAPATLLTKANNILIGRVENCDIVLDSAEVSRRHALVRQAGDKYILEDLDSTNGTYVNDEKIKQVELREGDLIQISSYRLLFQSGTLVPYQTSGMRLDVSALSRDAVAKRGNTSTPSAVQRILDDVTFSVLPREFVAVIGAGDSEKSTLLDALTGVRRGESKVRLNGHDFYREIERFRSQFGYAPDAETLHGSLTVEKALDYSARLRLPSSLTPDERMNRIDAALETVTLNTEAIRATHISNLSVGERKRLSIAAELLTDPKLIYLDEAASGLDSGLEKKMMHMLRRMADEGRTVILFTDSTNNILQADHVAFLSEGRLVYFGPAAEALEFFEVEDFADIYERIDRKGDEGRKVFEEQKPEQHRKYVLERQKNIPAAPRHKSQQDVFGMDDFFNQVRVLTRRAWDVIRSERGALAPFLLFPVMALLQLVIAKPDILTGNLAILADPVGAAKTMTENYTPFPSTNLFVFLMGLTAVFAGMFLPMNDLIRERSIYLRERMAARLDPLAYLVSKTLLYTGFAFAQVLPYLLIISFGVDFPARGASFNGALEIFITLSLTMLAGIGLGLGISAVSKSTQMGMYILAAVLLVQFFFAGALFDLRGSKLEPLSYLSPTRWSATALGVTIHMDKIAESTILCGNTSEGAANPACFNHPESKDDLRLPYDHSQLARSWSALIVMTILFLAATWFLLRREDLAAR